GGFLIIFFFSSRRRHTRFSRDWSSDVCSCDLYKAGGRNDVKIGTCATTGSHTVVATGPRCACTSRPDRPERTVLQALIPNRDGQIGRASCRERVMIRIENSRCRTTAEGQKNGW